MPSRLTLQAPIGLAQIVLRTLALFSPTASDWGVTEVARVFGCYKSRAHRALSLLEQERFLQRQPESGRYALGPRAYELGRAAAAHFSLAEASRPILEAMTRELRGAAVLRTLMASGEILTVELCESPEAIKVSHQEGVRTPFNFGATGKVLCAALSEPQLATLIRQHGGLPRFTPKTICDPERFQRELAIVRRRGYAFSDGEALYGVRGVAAPVFRAGGEVVAALGVTLPGIQLPLRRLPTMARAVRRAASELSEVLGATTVGPRSVLGGERA